MTDMLSDARVTAYITARRRLEARGYLIVGAGGEFSADAGDYWNTPDSTVLGTLVRQHHIWRTSTGGYVTAPRAIRTGATVGHIRRLERAATR